MMNCGKTDKMHSLLTGREEFRVQLSMRHWWMYDMSYTKGTWLPVLSPVTSMITMMTYPHPIT
jgi:acyl-coenzyme A synthetase/AMP-(fatty) acid ligase